MKKILLLTALATLAVSANALVIPGDTFSFYILGDGVSLMKTQNLTATFGTTRTFAGALLNGGDLTISSTEVVGATTTTDSITLSTATSFLAADAAGVTETFGFGDPLLPGSGTATGNGLNYLLSPPHPNFFDGTPGSVLSAEGSLTFIGGVLDWDENIHYNSLAGSVAGDMGVADLSDALALRSWTYSFTYLNPAPVPEPSALAALGLGGFALLRRRKRI